MPYGAGPRDDPRTPRIVIRADGAPGDLGWMIMAHGEVYAKEYGWDASFEALVARILADYAAVRDGHRACGWIAEVDGRRAGCVMVCAEDESTAELHTLLVEPWARGLRLGSRLVDQALAFARTAGYECVRLWTNDPLADARRLYLSRGFVLVSEEAHHSFGADLVGQTYEIGFQPAS
jgi:N-acetylglutamate synthase-like GNAT family acetyltransferase